MSRWPSAQSSAGSSVSGSSCHSSAATSLNSWRTESLWDDTYLPGPSEPAYVAVGTDSPWRMHEPAYVQARSVEEAGQAAHRKALWLSLGGAETGYPPHGPGQRGKGSPVSPINEGSGPESPGSTPQHSLGSPTHHAPPPAPGLELSPFDNLPMVEAALGDKASPLGTEVSRPPPTLVPLQEPRVVWCEATEGGDPAAEAAALLAAAELQTLPALDYFDASTKFGRWLFEQPRGQIAPSAVLISGWREAKPCAMAIHAARSGDLGLLRPDARRGELQPLTGNPLGQVGVAIGAMIVVVRRPDQANRVAKWIKNEGNTLTSMEITVALDTRALQTFVSEAFSTSTSPASVAAAAAATLARNSNIVSL